MSRQRYGLTDKAFERFISEVVQLRTSRDNILISRLASGHLTVTDRGELRKLLADELISEELGPDDEPTERGLVLEAAIDWLNRSR